MRRRPCSTTTSTVAPRSRSRCRPSRRCRGCPSFRPVRARGRAQHPRSARRFGHQLDAAVESGHPPLVLVLDPAGVTPTRHDDAHLVVTGDDGVGHLERRRQPAVLAEPDERPVDPDEGHRVRRPDAQERPSSGPRPADTEGSCGRCRSGCRSERLARGAAMACGCSGRSARRDPRAPTRTGRARSTSPRSAR